MRVCASHRLSRALHHLSAHLPSREAIGSAAMPSYVQLTPFEIGQIKAHMHHGLEATEIAGLIKKTDGKHPAQPSVFAAMQKLTSQPSWRGERAAGSGRPRATSAALDEAIVKLVFQHRGSSKVTVTFVRRRLPAAKRVSRSLVEDRLHEAGLRFLRRRRKTLVPTDYRAARCTWARKTLRRHTKTLRRWVYSDGTVFYIDKVQAAQESTVRQALGSHVWRMADGKDGLFAECVGPSSYAKAQGLPVRVWGLLVDGKLNITALPEQKVMNRWVYAKVIRQLFSKWCGRRRRPLVVQDYERCLRCDEPMEAFAAAGMAVQQDHPKYSQDLNAIENAWAFLRSRLADTQPKQLESRAAFCRRLRSANLWVNKNRKTALRYLCRNQKERARDVLALKGGRTKW